jgi:hypothetical protein
MWTAYRDKGRLNQFWDCFPSLSPQHWVRDQLSHAYCFHGNEPGNLFLFAATLIRRWLCDQLEEEPCGSCEGCRSIETCNDLRFFPVFPQGQSVSIERVRKILDSTEFNLQTGQTQVIAICFPAQMHKEAVNALLKTLEEPPPGRIFILINPYSRSLLPTLASRVQHLTVPSAALVFESLEPDELILARLCNFNLDGDLESLREIASSPPSLSHFYGEWIESFKETGLDLDLFLESQLSCPLRSAKRQLAILDFMDEVFRGDLGFLFKLIADLEASFKLLETLILERSAEQKRLIKEEMGKGFEHWLLGDGGSDKGKAFYRGFIFREMEEIFRSVLKMLGSIVTNPANTPILAIEKQVGLHYDNLLEPGKLFELSGAINELNSTLHHNVNWATCLEQLGHILLNASERN